MERKFRGHHQHGDVQETAQPLLQQERNQRETRTERKIPPRVGQNCSVKKSREWTSHRVKDSSFLREKKGDDSLETPRLKTAGQTTQRKKKTPESGNRRAEKGLRRGGLHLKKCPDHSGECEKEGRGRHGDPKSGYVEVSKVEKVIELERACVPAEAGRRAQKALLCV